MAEKAGIAAALESLGATAEPSELGEGEQLELLPSLPAAVTIGGAAVPRGAGRPPGARNRSTEAWRQYLLQRFGSPLEALLQVATSPIDELAREMGLKRGAAFRIQVDALEAALPYLHQKLPQAVELGLTDAPVLNLVVSQEVYMQVARPADGAVTLQGTIEGNQGVGDADGD